jgi:hypothetical protein
MLAPLVNELLQRLALSDFRLIGAVLVLLAGYLAYWVVSRSLAAWSRRGHVGSVMEQRLRTMLRLLALTVTTLVAVQQAGVFDHAWALLSAVATAVVRSTTMVRPAPSSAEHRPTPASPPGGGSKGGCGPSDRPGGGGGDLGEAPEIRGPEAGCRG